MSSLLSQSRPANSHVLKDQDLEDSVRGLAPMPLRVLRSFVVLGGMWLLSDVTGSWMAMGGFAQAQEAQSEAEEKSAVETKFSEEDLAFFREKIEPVFAKNCNECHGVGSKFRGGFSLAARDHLLKGGESGPAIDLDAPDSSVLIDAINFQSYEMPPSGKLPADQIAAITEWVKRGAPMPAPKEPIAMPVFEGPPQVNDENRAFWSFQPVKKPEVPRSKYDALAKNEIDHFLFARMEAAGVTPVGPADKRTLIRRLYFDVIGLPPTTAQVEAFVADTSPDAYNKVVDELLESPHYGEKWGRYWLDLVRYAETNSFERDNPKPNAWKYRDYVIEAFNKDKPYDRFLMEQLAGDELPDKDRESIIATGYYRLNAWDDEPADQNQAFYDEMDDILSTTGQVMLGMTVGCARCHDHKQDPMPQKDYYGLLAFMADVQSYAGRNDQMNSRWSQTDVSTPEVVKAHAERDDKLRALEKQMHEIEQAAILKMTGEDQRKTEGNERKKVLEEKLDRFLSDEDKVQYYTLKTDHKAEKSRRLPRRDMVLSVNNCQMPPRVTPLMIRGNPATPGEPVEPRFLTIITEGIPELPAIEQGQTTSGRRLMLAKWIASSENPLTSRVMVNRLWQMHFGKGIVKSSSNFGLKGDLPTHPELLDWMTSQFVENGFHLKPIHRLILNSYAWQMSGRPTPEQLEKDPQNDFYTHFEMRRLTAEEVRDSLLLVTGLLNPEMGGPSVYPTLAKEVLAGQSNPGSGWGNSSPAEQNRRSVYIHVKRSLLVPALSSLDFPDPDGSCPVRFATTQPTQALTSLNSKFYTDQARFLADRIKKDLGVQEWDDHALQHGVVTGLTLVNSRPPTTGEVERGLKLIQNLKSRQNMSSQQAFENFCLVVINLNEFVYLD